MSAEYARRQALIRRPRIAEEPLPVTAQRMAEARARFFRATPLREITEELIPGVQ